MKKVILALLALIPSLAQAADAVFAFGRDTSGQRCFVSYSVEQKPFTDSSDKLLLDLRIYSAAHSPISYGSIRVSRVAGEFTQYNGASVTLEGEDVLRPSTLRSPQQCNGLRPMRESAFHASIESRSKNRGAVVREKITQENSVIAPETRPSASQNMADRVRASLLAVY